MIPLHQTDAALAVALLVVDQEIGGVLLRGASGTGKSELLKETELHTDSVRIPLGADSEGLTGGIDLSSLLKDGLVRKRNGLIQTGSDSILVLEHLDLFQDSILDTVIESGRVVLGTVSISGDIRGRMLDTFGLCAVLQPLSNPEERLRVLVAHFFSPDSSDLLETAVKAREHKDQVSIPGWFFKACAFTCSALQVHGHRGELSLFRSSIALAALLGHRKAGSHHLSVVAPLALGHRCCGPTGAKPDPVEIRKSVEYAVEMARRKAKNVTEKRMQELTDSIISQVSASIKSTETTLENPGILPVEKNTGLLGGLTRGMRKKFFREVKKFSTSLGTSGSGRVRDSTRMVNDPVHGRPVRSIPATNLREIDPLLSIKAAAKAGAKPPFTPLKKQYWRKWEKSSRPRAVCMLAVDGSRSSQEYLRDLGIMLDGLFNSVFDQSSRVGLSVIKNGRSVILFPPVRNRLRVFGRIGELKPHGSSPLDELLSLSAAELRRISKSSAEKTFIILVSDCYPEPVPVGDIWNCDIYNRVRKQAVLLGRQGIPVLVVDPVQTSLKFVESSPGRRLGRFIAHATGGNLISFGKPAEFDIFGALKEDNSKPWFITTEPPGIHGTSEQSTLNGSLGSLLTRITEL